MYPVKLEIPVELLVVYEASKLVIILWQVHAHSLRE